MDARGGAQPPDDGNNYEVVRGELFVTPTTTPEHETILGRLTRVLDPYVAANGLGLVCRAPAVVRFEGSEAERDLFVRQPDEGKDWDEASTPVLVAEVLSGSTWRGDQLQKRDLYLDMGVPEYWMLDPERHRRTPSDRRPDVVRMTVPAVAAIAHVAGTRASRR